MSTITRSSKRSGSELSGSARKYQRYNPEDLQEGADLDYQEWQFGSHGSVPTTVEEKYAALALQDQESTSAQGPQDPATVSTTDPAVQILDQDSSNQTPHPALVVMLGRIVANQERIIELLQRIEAQQRHFADSEKAWTEALNATKTSLIELYRQSSVAIVRPSQTSKPAPLLQAPTATFLSNPSVADANASAFNKFF
ncbi:hypothetical protein 2 [Wenzhou tapeworm virus 1]|uniref:Uncharacterized protein n=1 Tax=Wenzhou tapeworm virus 1 TaxID=1923661 RepID=A0A1L3KN09_9MONO|nr:hypothetical protein 2 [Wenzhou tapeworm virus 1]APG78767.1 hypothetical protein 2 [Wenzhou tapeworm virus 1]